MIGTGWRGDGACPHLRTSVGARESEDHQTRSEGGAGATRNRLANQPKRKLIRSGMASPVITAPVQGLDPSSRALSKAILVFDLDRLNAASALVVVCFNGLVLSMAVRDCSGASDPKSEKYIVGPNSYPPSPLREGIRLRG